jgi:hypothetical protein
MKFVESKLSFSGKRLLRTLTLVALALGICACASVPSQNISSNEFNAFNAMPTQNRIMNNVRIKWEIRDDVAQYCARAYQMGREQAYLTPPLACAIWDAVKAECTVVTGPVTTHVALGHEVRHCFEGHFHR